MSKVTYSAGFTRNMGDFESLRLDVGVEDGPRGEESTEQAYNRIRDFVESKLMDQIEQLERAIVQMRQNIRDEARERKVANAAKKDEAEGK